MPEVFCPSCRRSCRVRRESLGHTVTCRHCAAEFVAEEPAPGLEPQDPSFYGSDPLSGRPIILGLALALAAAVLAVWLLARAKW